MLSFCIDVLIVFFVFVGEFDIFVVNNVELGWFKGISMILLFFVWEDCCVGEVFNFEVGCFLGLGMCFEKLGFISVERLVIWGGFGVGEFLIEFLIEGMRGVLMMRFIGLIIFCIFFVGIICFVGFFVVFVGFGVFIGDFICFCVGFFVIFIGFSGFGIVVCCDFFFWFIIELWEGEVFSLVFWVKSFVIFFVDMG